MKPQHQTVVPGVVAWRHPRPLEAAGRCIGRTDLRMDRRKAKRLAHRIRCEARRHGWPQVIHTSPLQRCALVGRVLKAWGWRHHVDEALLEMDFGLWDGQPWSAIAHGEVDAWCADFLHARPGGGESLDGLFDRVQTWANRRDADALRPVLVVAHAGWMLTLRWLRTREDRPRQAEQWPLPPGYGVPWVWP